MHKRKDTVKQYTQEDMDVRDDLIKLLFSMIEENQAIMDGYAKCTDEQDKIIKRQHSVIIVLAVISITSLLLFYIK